MKKKIGIVNLKINNILSIYEACVAAGYDVKIINEKTKDYNHNIIILPGIGSYKKAMQRLKKINFEKKIKNYVKKKNNLLVGICLGMQLFFTKSEEFGETKGLNLIEGSVKKINKKNIVPHTGWNNILKNKKDKLLSSIKKKNMFYFTHSYYCDPVNKSYIKGQTKYKNFTFCSIVQKQNIIGMQFHPEKSSFLGINLLKNFKNFKLK
jgi:glutamine amidotransferase